MTRPIARPEPNHPLTAIRRVGVVADIANAYVNGTVNVNIGGDTTVLVPCSFIGSWPPTVGDRVVVLASQGDYCIIGGIISGAAAPLVQVFTSGGTWTRPNGIRGVRVRVVGGGGGAGGCSWTAGQAMSGAGAGGGYAEKFILGSAVGATETVTVGAAGAAGASGNNPGGAGGASSFGSWATGNGGGGGSGMASGTGNILVTGGLGGTATGGDINVTGGDGNFGSVLGGVNVRMATSGGTPLGTGVRPSASVGTAVTGHLYGGGGASVVVNAANSAGSDGAAGVVIVESIY